MVAVELDHPLPDEVARGVVEREATHVERPQVERRPALQDPLGHHLARPTAGSDAVQEACGDEEVVELGRPAHHEVGVGGVGDRAVHQGPDTGLFEHRRALGGELGELTEAVEVGVEQPAPERRRDLAVDSEGDRVGLVATDQQTGPVGLVVHEVIWVAHRGHAAELDRRVAVDRPAQEVLVLDRHRRHPGADHAADLHPPHTGGVDDDLALDRLAGGGVDGGAAAAVDGDRRHRGVLADHSAADARPAGDRLGDRGRIDVAVGGQERCRLDVDGAHQREQRLGLVGRDDVHREPERLGHRGQPAQLHRALGRARQPQASGLVPVDGLAGLGLETAVHLDRLLEHARRVPRRAQLADQAGGMPGGPVGELVLLEDQHVALAVLRQPVGDRAAEDPAPDDHDAGPVGRLNHGTNVAVDHTVIRC